MALTKRYTIYEGGTSPSFSSTKSRSFRREQDILKSASRDIRNGSFRVRIHEMGPICKSRIMRDEEEEVEDGEFSDCLRKEELLDSNNCMWLSSGSEPSPSSCSEEYRLSSHLDLHVDAWLISLLSSPKPKSTSFISTSVAFFDGSRVNPIEEASLVLHQRTFSDEVILQENLKEEEVVSWLVTSIENESEVVTSQTCIADSRLISEKKSDLAYVRSDSPSIYRSSRSSSSSCSLLTDTSDEHSVLSSSSGSDSASEVVDLEEFSSDKPLFWPSDCVSDWRPEAKWDFFDMSPRKGIYKIGNSPKTSPDNLRLRVFSGKLDLEKRCKKRLLFGTGSNSSATLELKSTSGVKEVDRTRSMPSRLRKSTVSSVKIVPLRDDDTEEVIADEVFTKKPEVIADEVFTKKPAAKNKVLLEDLLLVEKLNAEPRIETVLGLDEFDGHEGVESEFNKDNFYLDEIL